MKKDFIVRRSIAMIEGKPHVETYSEQELVLCRDCIYWQDNNDGYPHIGCKWREDETPDPDDFLQCRGTEGLNARSIRSMTSWVD